MFYFGIYFWTILIVQGVILGFATSYLAGQKNKDKTTWFYIGFFLGIIGLIIIAASKTEDNQASFSGSSYGGSTTNTIKASKSLSSNIRYIDLDSPVEVRNAEIKVDESTGMAYINAEFKNISDKNVSALKFTAICYNSFGEPVNDSDSNKIELIMQDLDIGSKDTFGKNINYSLTGFEQTRVIDLMIDQVSFTNGEIWKKAESNLKDISSFKYDGDQELKKIAGEDAITYPLEDQDSWRCICAKFNRKTDNICINCGRVKSEVFNEYDRDGIKEKIIKFNEREQLEEAKSRKVKKIDQGSL